MWRRQPGSTSRACGVAMEQPERWQYCFWPSPDLCIAATVVWTWSQMSSLKTSWHSCSPASDFVKHPAPCISSFSAWHACHGFFFLHGTPSDIRHPGKVYWPCKAWFRSRLLTRTSLKIVWIRLTITSLGRFHSIRAVITDCWGPHWTAFISFLFGASCEDFLKQSVPYQKELWNPLDYP